MKNSAASSNLQFGRGDSDNDHGGNGGAGGKKDKGTGERGLFIHYEGELPEN